MPVQKFRSIEEMNKASAAESQETDFERFLRHAPAIGPSHQNSIRAACLSSRSIEEAQKAREKHGFSGNETDE